MCWNILKTQHSPCPASPSSRRVPRDSWCSGTPDCNNWRRPSPAHPSSHLPPPPPQPQAGLSLAMMVSPSFPGRLTCPLRPRRCLTLPQNASPPMTPVSSRSAGAGHWGGMKHGWRPCSPSFPSGSLRLPTESWVFRGCLSFHDLLYLILR